MKCKKSGCNQKATFDSKGCEKHSCRGKCYGSGYVEPVAGVKIRCIECDGTGLNCGQSQHGWSKGGK